MRTTGWFAALLLFNGAALVPTDAIAGCLDGVKNGSESSVDCGGECPPCKLGRSCQVARDCESGLCAGGHCEERPHRKDDPVPDGYKAEFSETDSAAVVRRIGLVTLGLSYGASYTAALVLPGELSWLYAPVVGPWVLTLREDQPKRGLLALDAAVQSVGLVLLLGGILAGGDRIVRDQEKETYTARIHVVPASMGSGGVGLGFFGQW